MAVRIRGIGGRKGTLRSPMSVPHATGGRRGMPMTVPRGMGSAPQGLKPRPLVTGHDFLRAPPMENDEGASLVRGMREAAPTLPPPGPFQITGRKSRSYYGS